MDLKDKAVSNYYTYLGFNTTYLQKLVEKDKLSCNLYRKGLSKIPICSKQKHRIEMLKLSTNIFSNFVIRLFRKTKIIIELKTKMINDYWSNNIDFIIKELDELINDYKPYYCGCKKETMCFNKSNGVYCCQDYLRFVS